jgi:FkbM family methyltransferase
MKTKLSRNIIFSRNGYKLRFFPSALTAALWLNPHPRIYSYLENNIELNKQNQCILTHCTALGEKAGTMFFSDKSDDTNNQLGTEGKLKVAIQMLDEVIPNKHPISLLKIDVEGFEYQVFQGASRVLEQTDFIYLECIPEMLS